MEAAHAGDRGQIERLRQQIRKLQAAPRSYLATLRTGLPSLDELLPAKGLQLGQAFELWGEAASGRTSLAFHILAAATREHRLGAFVDGPGELYPPAAAAAGVDLARLLIVRPRAPGKLVWTAVQLARSGAFACVVLDLTHTGVRLTMAESKKLSDAAFQGGSCLLLLTPLDAPGDGMTRLFSSSALEGLRVEVMRSRQGAIGSWVLIPWSALRPRQALVFRCLERRELTEARGDREAPSQSVQRTKMSWQRDGHGIARSRPGRDVALPELRSSLGL